ncbi:PRELI domain-containing protein 1, mitochondrial-like, partial [Amphiprion ocellaris]|uniref:PRELI domain-containing protein 1, mitochondrial-like n=1 Tax=Amphiprion ocellaris TaxID=80972 RepID=UPI00241118B3
MVKYFCNNTDIKSAWDHVVAAFWQRYPNPFSTHVLTEDVVYREVTADNRLFSRRLLMKTNRLPRWAERFFPGGMSRSVYIIEDSIVDPVNRSLTTYTWNLNHTTLMSVEERCVFKDSVEQPATTQLKREAWISSSIYGFSKPIQVHLTSSC